MERLPENIGTKEDILCLARLAMQGVYDRAALKSRLAGMLDAAMHYVYRGTVEATYVPAENERVMEQEVGGVKEMVCFEKIADPNAPHKRAGITKAELETIISDL